MSAPCETEDLELEGQCWKMQNLGTARDFAVDPKRRVVVFTADEKLVVATSEGEDLSVESSPLELDFLVVGIELGSFSGAEQNEALILGHSGFALVNLESRELLAVGQSTLQGGGGVAVVETGGQDRVVGFSQELGVYGLRSARWDGEAWATEWDMHDPSIACWVNTAVRVRDGADGFTVAAVTVSDQSTCEFGGGSHVLVSWSADGIQINPGVAPGQVAATSAYKAADGNSLALFWDDQAINALRDLDADVWESWSVSGYDEANRPRWVLGQLDESPSDEVLITQPGRTYLGRVYEMEKAVEFEPWDERLAGQMALVDLNEDGISEIIGISQGELVAWISKSQH